MRKSVPFVLTIVVSTGGHARPGVERFAITGVHA